ncbi:hypothetical protein R3P38DRAFT_2873854 [Favolaschia claudopus]|uniref:DUF6533 domain-containing protein n=1 Tax=Favolaschia claudopus TaxID=2862362 RepID=A0AAW0D4A8_9AGAR
MNATALQESNELKLFMNALGDIQATRFSQLASSAIIMFDHIITLDKEVELIWKRPWAAGKVIFIINRYYTMISLCVHEYYCTLLHSLNCIRFFQWQGWTGLIACMIAEVILQMRLYALYFLSKRVLILMASAFILSSASSAVILGTVLHRIKAHAHPLPPTPTTFCAPSNVPSYFFAFWIPIISFESLLCFLALFRGFQTFRTSGGSTLFQSGRHLVAILIRDSLLYFLVMFATYFTNMLVWASADPSLLEIPIAFSVALSCTLGNRLIFNVREVNQSDDDDKYPVAEGNSEPTIKEYQLRETRHESESDSDASLPAERRQQLTDIEMAQLRSMKAERSYGSSHFAAVFQ